MPVCLRVASAGGAETPLLTSMVGDIFGMCVPYTIFAKIDSKDTVDKLNKSKLSGNVSN